MKFDFLNKPATGVTFLIFFIAAFAVRAGVFYYYIQHEQRYCQPDTPGYAAPGLALYKGMGMSMPNGQPVFWRTPGYPAFLAPFFSCSPTDSWHFDAHEEAYTYALWLQILWCSLLPILGYILAWIVTGSLLISYIVAAISIVHPGFVLASTFLLTDGPAQIFFVIFLICLLKNLSLVDRIKRPYLHLALAALALSAYTWMRPMGQFVAVAALLIFCFFPVSFKEKCKQALFFIVIFTLSISPWFIRNYNLTGKVFFCPLFGLYFNVFNAPKIRARVEHIPHELAWKKQCKEAEQEVVKEYQAYAVTGNPNVIVNEMICMKPAIPWMLNYPHYFVYDWVVEVCKTTFDLYSYQFVSLYNNTFKWDPLVEYIGDKFADTLYRKDLPWYIRLLAYFELFSEIWLWIGIFAGLVLLVRPDFRKKYLFLWIPCGLLMGAVLCQTGGFGYARLRLPIELLIIILGLVFWLSRKNGKPVRAMAK